MWCCHPGGLEQQMWWGRGDSVKGQGVPAWNLRFFCSKRVTLALLKCIPVPAGMYSG